MVLKKKCPAIDTIIQYKAGAGGALMWTQMNQLPGDGVNVVGVNLPHIVFQPIEGQVQYKTQDITPVFWFHYTPDILVVPEQSPIRTFDDFIKAAKASPGKLSLGGSGQLGQPRRPRTHEQGLRREDHLRAVQGHGRHVHQRCWAARSTAR